MAKLSSNYQRAGLGEQYLSGAPKVSIVLSVVISVVMLIVTLSLGTSVVPAISVSVLLMVTGIVMPYCYRTPVLMSVFVNIQLFLAGPIINTLSGFPLDQLIKSPDLTFFMCSIFGISLMVLALYIGVGQSKVILVDRLDSSSLGKVSFYGLCIGISAIFLYLILGDYRGGGDAASAIGTFNKFMPFIVLPIIVFFFLNPEERTLKIRVCALTALSAIAIAILVMNARKLSIDAAVAAALAHWSRRGRFSLRFLLPASLAALFLLTIVSNVITLMRTDVLNIPAGERAAYVLERLPDYVQRSFTEQTLDTATLNALAAPYLDYIGRNPWAQRFSGQQITGLVVETLPSGVCPADPIRFGVNQALPAGLSGPKVNYSFGDEVTWYMQLRNVNVVGFPFFPLLPSAIACYGSFGGVVVSVGFFALAMLAIRFVAPSLRGSVWGVFIAVICYNAVIEGEIPKYINLVMRILPEVTVVAFIVMRLANREPSNRLVSVMR